MHGGGAKGTSPPVLPSICLLLLVFLATGCASTTERLWDQRLAMAKAQSQGMEQTLDYLRANPDPEAASSIHAFVSNQVVNRALSFVDDTTAVYEGRYLLRLERVRLSSAGGFPRVSVSASASRWGLTARLGVSAIAVMTLDTSDLSTGTISVHIEEVTPEIAWYDLHLMISGFARDLVQTELQNQLEEALPPFEVPLVFADDLRADSRQEDVRIQPDGPFWEGYIDGRVTYPPLDVGVGMSIDRVLFLEDGIHCFLSFEEPEATS